MEIDIKMVPNYRESEYFQNHNERKKLIEDLQYKINKKHILNEKGGKENRNNKEFNEHVIYRHF